MVAQIAIAARPAREALATGIAVMIAGLALVVTAVWLSNPSLALFLIGGALTGAGAGSVFKGAISIVTEIAPPQRRAEALAGMFLAGYIGLIDTSPRSSAEVLSPGSPLDRRVNGSWPGRTVGSDRSGPYFSADREEVVPDAARLAD